jgi:hypothetical protein
MGQVTNVIKIVVYFLGIFQILGIISVLLLTGYSMFTLTSYTLVYLVLIAFTCLCWVGLWAGAREIEFKYSMGNYLKIIQTITMVLLMLLILGNLITILHNANAIDQFFGLDSDVFRKGSFWGHLILEVFYFYILLRLIDPNFFK